MGRNRTGLSPWQGRLLALGLGICLVAGVEAVLRLVPGWAPPPLAVEVAARAGQRLYTLNAAYPRNFFAGRIGAWSLEGIRLSPQPFMEPRADRAVRILCVGASTIQGYPHPQRLAAAACLQEMLQRVWPDRTVEVINAGITSIASFAVARTVEDAVVLKPDLVVVYTGHNEFYGVYGAAAFRQGGSRVRMKRLYDAVLHWRLTALARYLVDQFAPSPEAPPISLLEAMTRAGPVGPDDSRRALAGQNLRDNLTDLVRFCRARGILVVLCTLASNQAGFAPDMTTAFVPLSPEQKAGWLALVSRADTLLQQSGAEDRGAAQKALEYLDQAAAECDRYALLHYLRGQGLVRIGAPVEARQAFLTARELDTVPLRAPASFSAIVRQVAQDEGVLLADVAAAFDQAAPPQGPGWELLVDHVHPAVAGQVLLARTVVQALRQAPDPVRLTPDQEERLPGPDEVRRALGDLPVEEVAVARAMARLLGQPPFDRHHEEQVRQLEQQAATRWARLSLPEQQGYGRWEESGKKAPLVLSVADQLFEAQRFDQALLYYQATRREIPYTAGELWATLRWGRCLLFQRGRLEDEEIRQLQAAVDRAYLLAQTPAVDPAFLKFVLDYAHRLVRAGRTH